MGAHFSVRLPTCLAPTDRVEQKAPQQALFAGTTTAIERSGVWQRPGRAWPFAVAFVAWCRCAQGDEAWVLALVAIEDVAVPAARLGLRWRGGEAVADEEMAWLSVCAVALFVGVAWRWRHAPQDGHTLL